MNAWDLWRNLNIVLALIASILVLIWLHDLWRKFFPSERLAIMALLVFCLIEAGGTFEVLYLNTQIRVAASTLALLLVIAASFLPRRYRRRDRR